MDFEYEFAVCCENTVLSIDIKPNKLIFGERKLIFEWLLDDVMESFNDVHKIIEDVQNEKIESSEWAGNANTALICKDTTTITCNFEELEVEPCVLPTQMLKEILDIWEKEYDRFYGRTE